MNYFSFLKQQSVLLLVFLLPWQTRLLFIPVSVGGAYLEYATVSIYATELLAWFVLALAFVSGYPKLRGLLSRVTIPYVLAWLGVAGLFLASVLASNTPWLSWYTLYRLVLAGGVAGVIARSNEAERRRILWALWLGAVGQGIVAMYQFFAQRISASTWFGIAAQSPRTLGVSVVENAAGRWLRAYGSFGWPTSLGIYLGVALVIGVVLYMHASTLRSRLILLSGELVMLAGSIFTFARGAWIGTSIGCGAVFAVAVYRWARYKNTENSIALKKLVFLCGALVVLAAVYGYLVRALLLSRLSGEGVLEERSLSERSSQYHDSVSLLRLHPWLGVGPGTYSLYLYQHFPERRDNELQPVHNIYVLLLAQYGFLPLLAVGGLGCYCLMRRRWRGSFLAMGPLLVIVVAGCFDHWPVSLWSGLLLMAVVGSVSFSVATVRQTEPEGMVCG